MNIDLIKQKIKKGDYEISFHAHHEALNEEITFSDIENVIYNGVIIENYEDDPRGKSCLIMGYSDTRPVHIVCGYSLNGNIRIITVYLPKLPKWLDEKTRNKGGDKNV